MTLPILLCIFSALIFLTYGILMHRIGSVTRFHLVWFAMSAAAGLLAAALYLEVFRNLSEQAGRLIFAVAVMILVFFVCVEACIFMCFRLPVPTDLDIILVLGSHVFSEGPCIVLQGRLDRAIAYLEKNPQTLCIVSGGQGSDEPASEAEVMARYMIAHGIDADRILREDRSTTTKENLKFSCRLIPEGAALGLITSDFHLFRALQMARKQGLRPIYGIPAASSRIYLPNNMFREFFALLLFWFRG